MSIPENVEEPHWLERINQWMPSGGSPTGRITRDLTFRAPAVSCPYCSVEGVTSPMQVVAITACGGYASVLWFMMCEHGHEHVYPATTWEPEP